MWTEWKDRDRKVVLFRHFMATVVVGASAFGGLLCMATPARAEFVVTVSQDGANIVATGSGSINTAGLTDVGGAFDGGASYDGDRFIVGGLEAAVQFWTSISGPANFGPTGDTWNSASSGSGDVVGVIADSGIYLPDSYVSGSALSGTSTWDNTTLSALNLTPGTYDWTWGSGDTADGYELVVNGGQQSVPESSSLLLLAVPLAAAAVMRRRRESRPAV
ncbi:MAG TPA: hypothetical protein DDZ81_05665 [Acetobacteraceae bacterium]|nr:hypothetical protein [Acetobacteraceae bacterium]